MSDVEVLRYFACRTSTAWPATFPASNRATAGITKLNTNENPYPALAPGPGGDRQRPERPAPPLPRPGRDRLSPALPPTSTGSSPSP